MVKLFAPATGAAAVVLAASDLTAEGIVDEGVVAPVVIAGATATVAGGAMVGAAVVAVVGIVVDVGGVVWARAVSALMVLRSRVANKILFIRVLQVVGPLSRHS